MTAIYFRNCCKVPTIYENYHIVKNRIEFKCLHVIYNQAMEECIQKWTNVEPEAYKKQHYTSSMQNSAPANDANCAMQSGNCVEGIRLLSKVRTLLFSGKERTAFGHMGCAL